MDELKKLKNKLEEAAITGQGARQGFYQGGTWRSTPQLRRQAVMAGRRQPGESAAEHDLRSIEELEQSLEKAVNFMLAPISYNASLTSEVSSQLRMFKNRMQTYIKNKKDQLEKQLEDEKGDEE